MCGCICILESIPVACLCAVELLMKHNTIMHKKPKIIAYGKRRKCLLNNEYCRKTGSDNIKTRLPRQKKINCLSLKDKNGKWRSEKFGLRWKIFDGTFCVANLGALLRLAAKGLHWIFI